MWQSSNTIRAGHMHHIALCCLEGSTPQDRCLSLFIALRWRQEPCGVMMGLTENIQACLRIFRRAQHQWLARDILHLPQGVFAVFVLHPPQSLSVQSAQSVVKNPLAYCPPGRGSSLVCIRGRCPRLLIVVPSRHRSACWYW